MGTSSSGRSELRSRDWRVWEREEKNLANASLWIPHLERERVVTEGNLRLDKMKKVSAVAM